MTNKPVEYPEHRNALLATPINSQNEAEIYLLNLWHFGLDYHPEDNAADVVGPNGPLFTPEQAALADKRMIEVFQHLDDPCAYLLDLTIATDRE